MQINSRSQWGGKRRSINVKQCTRNVSTTSARVHGDQAGQGCAAARAQGRRREVRKKEREKKRQARATLPFITGTLFLATGTYKNMVALLPRFCARFHSPPQSLSILSSSSSHHFCSNFKVLHHYLIWKGKATLAQFSRSLQAMQSRRIECRSRTGIIMMTCFSCLRAENCFYLFNMLLPLLFFLNTTLVLFRAEVCGSSWVCRISRVLATCFATGNEVWDKSKWDRNWTRASWHSIIVFFFFFSPFAPPTTPPTPSFRLLSFVLC